jgi:hypothetical protein
MNVEYSRPNILDICIGFCYYNPSEDPLMLQNTLAFESKLKASSLPYFTIELIKPNSKPVLENPTLVVEATSMLFYKESLWNLLEKKIPESFHKICFMDTNLLYTRPDWLDCISLLLNFYDIVQPFNQVNILDITGNVINTIQSASKTGNLDDIHGNAWAVKRDFFRNIGGFYDKSVICPNLFFSALTGRNIDIPLLDKDFAAYSEKLKNTGCKMKYLNTEVNSVINGPVYNFTMPAKSLTNSWDSLFSLNSSGLWELNDITVPIEVISDIKEVSSVKQPLVKLPSGKNVDRSSATALITKFRKH